MWLLSTIWKIVGHFLNFRELLQWAGYWETVVALIISILTAIASWLTLGSLPITISLFVVAFILVTFVIRIIIDWKWIWPVILIDNLREDDEVEFKQLIYGYIYPSRKPVQIFIKARDRRYYGQKNVTRNGARWAVNCQFGDQTSPSGSSYEIVVISGKQDVLDSPINKIPGDVARKIIRVRRR